MKDTPYIEFVSMEIPHLVVEEISRHKRQGGKEARRQGGKEASKTDDMVPHRKEAS